MISQRRFSCLGRHFPAVSSLPLYLGIQSMPRLSGKPRDSSVSTNLTYWHSQCVFVLASSPTHCWRVTPPLRRVTPHFRRVSPHCRRVTPHLWTVLPRRQLVGSQSSTKCSRSCLRSVQIVADGRSEHKAWYAYCRAVRLFGKRAASLWCG